MHSIYNHMRILVTAITCFFSFTTLAQDSTVWSQIQIAIDSKSNLQNTKEKLELIKQKAIRENHAAHIARAYCYIMLIDELRSEDTLYFRNSAFIDSIIFSPSASPSLKQLMHYLQAQRLYKFRSKYLKFNRARYERSDLQNNYATFSNQQFDSIINYHFDEAKKMRSNYAVSDILWLSSSPTIFLFEPDIQDIILAEQITFAIYKRSSEFEKELLQLPANKFITAIHTLDNDALKLYHAWLSLHINDEPVYYYIVGLAHQYVYNIAAARDNSFESEKQYEKFLKTTIESPYPLVKAYGISQLALLWANTDTSQYAPAKALSLFESNQSLFELYPVLLSRLQNMRHNILSKKLELEMDDINIPSDIIKANLTYKNISRLHYRVIGLYQNEKLPENENIATAYLLKKPFVKEKSETLPLPADHNIHRTELNIEALPPGRYALLFADDTAYTYQTFYVTQLTVLHTDDRVYVLDRKTGMPIPGVKATVSYGKKTRNEILNDRGYFVLHGRHDFSMVISNHGDTTMEDADTEKETPDNIYDKEEYDDLVEFYSDNTTLHIFTDRSIYRPGQKVFYKAILISTNPRTGEALIMNEQNLRKGLHNYLKKWAREEEPYLFFRDPFGREIDSVKIIPDAYGSVSGFFTIPLTAATGEWNIESDVLDTYGSNNGSLKVEEYKRPTFELLTDKPTKTYMPGDTISFLLRIRSFTGAILNNSKVSYDVERKGSSPDYRNVLSETVELIDSMGYTNDNGEIMVRVADSSLRRIIRSVNTPWSFTYTLFAEATDATGETHEITSQLYVSTRPVSIRLIMPSINDISELRPLLITTKDVNGLDLFKLVTVKLYKLQTPSDTSEMHPVFETKINTATFDKFRWPENLLPGVYKLTARTVEDGKILGEQKRIFTLFANSAATPEDKPFFHVPVTEAAAGDTLRLFSGSPYDRTYCVLQVKYLGIRNNKLQTGWFFHEKIKAAGVSEWKWKIPEGVRQVLITEIFVINNILYKHARDVSVMTYKDEPQIIVEQYRSKITPGSKETFSVSIKTKNKAVAAQLMSVIYDESLDKIEEHQWTIPPAQNGERLSNGWDGSLHSRVRSTLPYAPVQDPIRFSGYGFFSQPLQGRVSGIDITNAAGLESVVVTGYSRRLASSTSSITIRGISSLANLEQPLIVLDGVIYSGDLSSIKPAEITQAMILKGSEAAALYGSRAASGVLILSTKGDIKLSSPPEPVVKIRSNFDETAFFSPAIYAGKDGLYRITFTMPESVTEWNWKMLAHTKRAMFTYLAKKFSTQLPLMVQPNMPRILYQGDHIVLKSRVSNLDTISITGIITCKVEDVVTGMDITSTIVRAGPQSFTIGAKLSAAAAVELWIPPDFIHPLKITVKAASANFADAEEHIIPVLSTKIFVRQSVPLYSLQADTILPAPTLPGDALYYGTGLSITPKPQSGLINSLPFLANYSWDCAEQMFNKLYAYATAIKIMRTDTAARQSYAMASATAEVQNNKLPEEINEQTMPWMNLLNKTADQQRRLFLILDTVRSKEAIENYLEKLYTLQKPDGGLSWFPGGKSNQYISNYVLAGFGKLAMSNQSSKYEKFIKELLKYCDEQFVIQPSIFYVYARSLFLSQDTLIKKYITRNWKASHSSLYERAMLIIVSLKYFSAGESVYQKAKDELNDLYQLSIRDNNSITWKDIADADDLEYSAEETMALLSEAFSLSGYSKEINEGMIKWLLRTQTEHHWTTTKGTAAAIGILQKERSTVFGPAQVLTVNAFSVTDDLLHGSSYAFIPSQIAAPLSVKKQHPQPASGNIIYYYFSSNPVVTGDVKLSKKLYVYNKASNTWLVLADNSILRIADKVKVVITIETAKALRYVYIDDKRAAGFEPEDINSGYEYGKGFSYYKSVRDAGFQFFTEFVPAGRTEINYEMIVSQEGLFNNGLASLECMYNPGITAYSNGVRVRVEK